MARIEELLANARRRLIVGRTGEIEVIRNALSAETLPFSLVRIYGPGGIGKTTLLSAFADLCRQHGRIALTVDARNLQPTPDAFIAALGQQLSLPPNTDPVAFLSKNVDNRRYVLLVDTYEMLAPLDNWMRERFLPQLPTEMLVVLAGREMPSAAWRYDAGWQQITYTVALRNLSSDASRAYLTERDIPVSHHESILNFTHGFPLGLSLVADVYTHNGTMDSRKVFQPEENPDIVRALLERFYRDVPGAEHRAALEICALIRFTDEAILNDILAGDLSSGESSDTQRLFQWLQTLSFVESGRSGLFPHDMAREALLADLRWRNHDRYLELHRRARNYYNPRLWSTTDSERQQRALYDSLFLHRDNSVVRAAFTWQENAPLATDRMRPGDVDFLCEMVAVNEGNESARIARLWFESQPHSVVVYRATANGEIAGFLLPLALHETTAAQRQQDPAARAAWEYLENNTPLRPGEAATHFRFWMARDTYHSVSPVQSLIVVHSVRHYLTTPNLAFSFFAVGRPDFWHKQFEYGEMLRLPDADFTVGDRRYGIYGQDWRRLPPSAWLARLAEKEVAVTAASGANNTPPVRSNLPLIVLSESDFGAAVRDALRGYSQPATLTKNPLLRSRVVTQRAGITSATTAKVAVLLALLRENLDTLQAAPRRARGYRAIYRTYIDPAPTQEAAAELLDLPFSTYRRHLADGLSDLVGLLWQQEIGESEHPPKK